MFQAMQKIQKKRSAVWTCVLAIGLSGCGQLKDTTSELESVGLAVVNSLTSVMSVIVGDRNTAMSGVVVGHALPKGVSANDLKGWKQKTFTFEKKAKSNVLKNWLLEAKYEITYQCGGSYKGKGAYLANIMMTPKSVWVASLYKYKVVAVSNEALNEGSKDQPVAALKFVVTHTMDGLVTAAVSDTFQIDAKSCEIQADLNDFN